MIDARFSPYDLLRKRNEMTYHLVIQDRIDLGPKAEGLTDGKRFYVAVHSTPDTPALWDAEGATMERLLRQAGEYIASVERGDI